MSADSRRKLCQYVGEAFPYELIRLGHKTIEFTETEVALLALRWLQDMIQHFKIDSHDKYVFSVDDMEFLHKETIKQIQCHRNKQK